MKHNRGNDQLSIYYHKWDKKNRKKLFRSVKDVLNIESSQFYMPLFSLYYYIHNTSSSFKTIDFQRKYYITEINAIRKERYYNSNMFLEGILYDSHTNTSSEKEFFCKTIPILDPNHIVMNNYNLVSKNNYHLPSNYNYNTFKKINNMNNTAYIDVFCSYLFSQLTIQKINPSFAIYYGSLNGIGNYNYDITEEYHELIIEKCFNKNIGKGFTMEMYISSDEEESDDDDKSDIQSCESHNDDYVAVLKKTPIQLLFMEKLEGTLEDIINDASISNLTNLLKSCLFQISFALSYLQKHYQFTHNDLHINNIMFKKTEKKFLYYKINNTYYQIPTFGKIFKIIDFGRSIFTFKNKIFMNDVFSKNSEAGGQYYYPDQVDFLQINVPKDKIIKPNYHFDLCRLSMTILEELDKTMIEKDLLELFEKMCIDCNQNSFCDLSDNFNLYISIAKNAQHSLPSTIIQSKVFSNHRISKKKFPLKSFYSL